MSGKRLPEDDGMTDGEEAAAKRHCGEGVDRTGATEDPGAAVTVTDCALDAGDSDESDEGDESGWAGGKRSRDDGDGSIGDRASLDGSLEELADDSEQPLTAAQRRAARNAAGRRGPASPLPLSRPTVGGKTPRGLASTPGRPRVPSGPAAVLRLALDVERLSARLLCAPPPPPPPPLVAAVVVAGAATSGAPAAEPAFVVGSSIAADGVGALAAATVVTVVTVLKEVAPGYGSDDLSELDDEELARALAGGEDQVAEPAEPMYVPTL
ncbi:hypothetical protein T492DRAFT_842226 [Pavlovales sp. CCMP2436]|nr:hypothetical protein T492DRAFT_842226 [Pavlovales sp. CCMP2436]